MCECLLEASDQVETSDEPVCNLQVHTTYHLGSDPVDPNGFTPRAQVETDVRLVWLGEDEI
jgi:hypothetical protein